MSWSVLKRSFSKFNEKSIRPIRPVTKRNVRKRKQNENKLNIIEDSDDENYFENVATKRSKLNITQTRVHNILNTQKIFSEDEGEIYVDPDSDDCCVGCVTQRPTLQPLPLFNCKENSPKKLLPIKSKCANNSKSKKEWKLLKNDFNEKRSSEDDIVIHEVNSDPEDSKISDPETSSQVISSDVIFESSSEGVLSGIIPTPQIEESSSGDPSSGKSKKNASPEESSKNNFEYNFLALEAQKEVHKEQRIHAKKGGLLEKLRKVLKKHESDYAFWQHERKIGLAEQGIEVYIKEKELCFGRCIITLKANKDKEFKIIIDPNAKINKFLSTESKAEICINNCTFYKVDGSTVYLAANKIIKK